VTGLIVARAEGNPFFLEELARTVAAEGTGPRSLAVPGTIQAVLAARMERLPEDARSVLQAAAVLGREAPLAVLRLTCEAPGELDAALRELARHEFLHERLDPAGAVHSFTHALTQEVAYESLLEPRRALLHARAGRALEESHGGRHEDIVELLAHHYGRSDESERAVDCALLAAEKAMRRWANAEALRHFDAALARLADMPDMEANRLRRVDGVLRQAEVKFALGRHVEHIAALEAIRHLVEDTGDPRRRATWRYWTGFLHCLTGGDLGVAIGHCREASALADAHGLEDVRALAGSGLAQAGVMAGDLHGALAAGERALAAFEARGEVWSACRALWILSVVANALGEWARGLAYCRRALAHAESLDDNRMKVAAIYRTASTHIQQGDAALGLAVCEQALAMSPAPFDAAVARAIHGYGLVKAGAATDGIRELVETIGWFAGARLLYTRSLATLWLAEGHLRAGDTQRAARVAGEALAMSRELGYRHHEGVALGLLGAALASHDPEGAARHLEAASRTLEETGARNELAKTLVARAQLRRAAGEAGEARELLDRALAIFEALGTLDEPLRARAAAMAPEASGPGDGGAYIPPAPT
jgi:tetratricopeptide (TPR) repeat protein